MALFEINSGKLKQIKQTSFIKEKISERYDIQQILKKDISVLDKSLLVISEEFSDWDGSSRSIDLLAMDKEANIVVIELKRTEDGGHMELQAIRYAAMVSTLTFPQTVDIYQKYIDKNNLEIDAEENILQFLNWEKPDEESFGNSVHIFLVSANFSKEITTSVLWLNSQGLDIKCFRIIPYKYEKNVLLSIEQVLPLPEAQEYQVQIRKKEQLKKSSGSKKKSLEEILSLLKTNVTEKDFNVAQKILTFFKKYGDTVYTTSNGFGMKFTDIKKSKHFIKVSYKGEIQFFFNYPARYPPFNNENLRIELKDRLNKISGLNITKKQIKGQPYFLIDIFRNEDNLLILEETLKWISDTVRNYELPE